MQPVAINPTMLLVFVLETIAAPRLRADRFVSPAPVRVVISHKLSDVTGAFQRDAWEAGFQKVIFQCRPRFVRARSGVALPGQSLQGAPESSAINKAGGAVLVPLDFCKDFWIKMQNQQKQVGLSELRRNHLKLNWVAVKFAQ